MIEITKIGLENEMDLILANRRAMKLAELAGFSLSGQTTFATSVSEISRSAIEYGRHATLVLNVSNSKSRYRELTAVISDPSVNFLKYNPESIAYARRLAGYMEVSETAQSVEILLNFRIPAGKKVSQASVEQWKTYFTNEEPASPYDEIKRKNQQLQQMADQLRESENKYKSLAESLPLMIFSLDKDGNIVYTNKWLIDFTGAATTVINKSILEQIAHPDDYERIRATWRLQLGKGKPFRDEWRLRSYALGEYLWHLVSVMPMYDEEGRVSNWFGFLVDIHAQKLIQQTLKDNLELKEAQQRLQEYQTRLEMKIEELNRSNYELEQFAYVASHDLQEPLRKIIFYSDYIQKKYAPLLEGKDHGTLQNMVSATLRMKGLIEDLLTYSGIQKEEFSFEQTDLNEVAANVLADLEIMVKESGARVKVSQLPQIEANPLYMQQLFTNLIGNAIKYAHKDTPPEICIEGRIEGENAVFSVQDNGIGFDEKHLGRIFGLFQRLHTRQQFRGTGIGLAICKKIVELHRGWITAESSLNSGSKFIVTLPLSQSK